MKKNEKVQVIIASNSFIQRLGIKTIVNAIGIPHELSELCSFNELRYLLAEKRALKTYVIFEENILTNVSETEINELIEEYSSCKFLYVCNQIPKNCTARYFFLNSCKAEDIIDKFQSLFFANEDDENTVSNEKSILSERELDVVKEVALGLSNKEIAEKLFISINTVISHRKNITDKLDIKSIAGLTVYAMMNNLINPDDIA